MCMLQLHEIRSFDAKIALFFGTKTIFGSLLCNYIILPNKVKSDTDIKLSVNQHYWRSLGPNDDFSDFTKV